MYNKTAAAASYVSRSEAVTLIYSSLNVPIKVPNASVTVFPDILPNSWYAKYMYRAAQDGIIDASPSSGLLKPHQSVTRGELLKMVTLAYGLPTDLDHSYLDSSQENWFNTYVGLAEKYNLYEAQGDTHIFAENFVTLTEASQAISILQATFPELRTIPMQNMSNALSKRF